MHDLNITLIQTSLYWEDAEANLEHFSRLLKKTGPTDLVILPEMFNTGFITEPGPVAETMEGITLLWMKQKAKEHNTAICGSAIIKEGENYYNRFIFVTPDGGLEHSDKRHLFSMAGEHHRFSRGKKRLVISYKGWNILPMVCYDLRFPAWSRNSWRDGKYEYDLLIYVANWPEVRSFTWKTLLPARAIENLCYVAAVNRVGIDGNGLAYSGDSAVIDPKGKNILSFLHYQDAVQSIILSKNDLTDLREKFNAGPDWDRLNFDNL